MQGIEHINRSRPALKMLKNSRSLTLKTRRREDCFITNDDNLREISRGGKHVELLNDFADSLDPYQASIC